MIGSSEGVVEEPTSRPLGPWSSRRPSRGAEGAAIGLAPIVYCNCRRIEYKRRVVDCEVAELDKWINKMGRPLGSAEGRTGCHWLFNTLGPELDPVALRTQAIAQLCELLRERPTHYTLTLDPKLHP